MRQLLLLGVYSIFGFENNLHTKLQNTSKINVKKESEKELQKEIKRLQKENGYLKQINEVLKKSTAIFSQAELPPFKK